MSSEFPRKGGCARRQIDLKRWDERSVVGWLEDDFHHFGVTLVHQDGLVTDISMAAPRTPYSICPGAAAPLRALIGAALLPRASDIGKWIEMKEQCTHVFDLAGLLLAHAFAGRDHRHYEAIVADRPIIAVTSDGVPRQGAGVAELLQDGVTVLRWEIDGPTITAPSSWQGCSMEEGFRLRTEQLDIELAERATVLRRAVFIASGRLYDLDQQKTAAENRNGGRCYTHQPGRKENALRNQGSTRNYQEDGRAMLAHRGEKP